MSVVKAAGLTDVIKPGHTRGGQPGFSVLLPSLEELPQQHHDFSP